MLGDRSLFALYEVRRSDFLVALSSLQALDIAPELAQQVDLVAEEEAKIHQGLKSAKLSSRAMANTLAKYDPLASMITKIQLDSNEAIRDAINALQHSAEKARTQSRWQLATLIPVASLISILIVLLMLRPLRRLHNAIRGLGEGDLNTRIAIKGLRDLEELAQGLERMRVRIREIDEQKTTFLQHMSHELKTPLASIREGSDLLGDEVIGPLNEEQREVADLLKSNSSRLQSQIEGLLQFSVASSETLSLHTERVALDHLIESVVGEHLLTIKAKNLSVLTELEPISINCDPEKLRTVIDNLLSNAIRYSPADGHLGARLRCEGNEAIIEVADEGPGIASEDMPMIFDAFYQGRTATDGPVRGTGLGLSIVKAYVDLHDGQIVVKSHPEGTILQVRLPVA